MALCSFAEQHLLPESATQPAIKPTQVIDHTIVGTVVGTDDYFRNHTNVETHFGIRYSGVIFQWMNTAVRADGNYHANRRPDGTGAISIETEGYASEPWTDTQVDALVKLHVWLARTHDGIGHRICRNATDPGFGYHVMFGAPGEWTPVAKDCPGAKRIKQWRELVIPRTLAELAGRPAERDLEDEIMAMTPAERADFIHDIAAAVVTYPAANPAKPAGPDGKPVMDRLIDFVRYGDALHLGDRDVTKAEAKALAAKVDAIAAKVDALTLGGGQVDVEALVNALADKFAERLES